MILRDGTTGLAFLLRQFWQLLRQEKSLALAYLMASLLAAATEGIGVSLLFPLLQAGGIDSSLASKPVFGPLLTSINAVPESNRFAIIAGVLLIAVVMRGLLLYAVQVINEILPLRVQRRLMDDAYQGLINVEIGYLSRNKVGTVTSAVDQLPVRISSLVLQLLQGFFSLILIGVYIGLMLLLSWTLTLLTVLFFGLVSMILRKVFTDWLGRIGARLTRATAHTNTLLHETVSGLRLIRLSAAEAAMSDAFSVNVSDVIDAKAKLGWVRSVPSPLLATVAGAFICALLAGGSLFFKGAESGSGWIASILLFNVLVFRLLVPVSTINTARHYIASEMSALDEYSNFQCEMREFRQPSGQVRVEQIDRGVHFENVTFRYSGESEPALRNFTLTLEKGAMTALVGPSGAGKSTVAGLLARLYDPVVGRILVDDTDLRAVDVGSWHRVIGYVSQEAFIFNDTLANNMRFVRPHSTDAEIRHVLALAAAEDVLAGMPDGLETVLGDRGTRLSGGQIQRIALARTILADPQLLILDEATSALDSISEAAIQRSFERVFQGRTVLAIAHRLSTVVRADKIVVIENGVMREQGSHNFLSANSFLYQELLRHQSRGMLA